MGAAMANKFTNVTRTSYGGRLGKSLKNVLVGIVMFVAAFVVLWINEGNSVKVQSGINEGRKVLVELESPKIDKANDGKLVYVSGRAESSGLIEDKEFNIVSSGLMLERKVEMYQWDEESTESSSESIGGSEETTTEYTYKKIWSDDLVDSSNFYRSAEHANPSTMAFESKTYADDDAKLGDFRLPESILSQIKRYEDVSVAGYDPSIVPGSLTEGKYISIPANSSRLGSPVAEHQIDPATGEYVDSVDQVQSVQPAGGAPQIGDIRISYRVVTDGPVSVIAAQTGSSLGAFTAGSGTKLEIVKAGEHSSEELFAAKESENNLMTWLFRLGGFLLMWFGLMLVLGPLSMILAFLPILRQVTGALAGAVAFAVALVLSLLTIAIAWLFYRPILAIGLILGAVAIAVAVKVFVLDKLKKKAPDATATTDSSDKGVSQEPSVPDVATATDVPVQSFAPSSPVSVPPEAIQPGVAPIQSTATPSPAAPVAPTHEAVATPAVSVGPQVAPAPEAASPLPAQSITEAPLATPVVEVMASPETITPAATATTTLTQPQATLPPQPEIASQSQSVAAPVDMPSPTPAPSAVGVEIANQTQAADPTVSVPQRSSAITPGERSVNSERR